MRRHDLHALQQALSDNLADDDDVAITRARDPANGYTSGGAMADTVSASAITIIEKFHDHRLTGSPPAKKGAR